MTQIPTQKGEHSCKCTELSRKDKREYMVLPANSV